MLPILKEAVVFLKRPSLDPTILENSHSVSKLPFRGKAVGRMGGTQIQRALDEADSRPGCSTETTLLSLYDDFGEPRTG